MMRLFQEQFPTARRRRHTAAHQRMRLAQIAAMICDRAIESYAAAVFCSENESLLVEE
jgi:hypothetical protein